MSEEVGQLLLSRLNQADSVLFIWLEPWADEFEIPVGASVEITIKGARAEEANIEESPGRIVVYGPKGSRLEVKIDGLLRASGSSSIVVPDMGKFQTKEFVDLVFGKFPEMRPGGRPMPSAKEPKFFLYRMGLGLGLAFLAQFLAFLLAGAGHGWVTPTFISVGLWFLMPLTFVIAWPTERTAKSLLVVVALITLGADALLVARSLDELSYIGRYVEVNGAIGYTFIGLWLALWFCWQVILLYSLVARRGHD